MNIIKNFRIKTELKKFKQFKNNYIFEFKELMYGEDGSLFVDGKCVRRGPFDHIAYEDDYIVNAGYISKDSQLSKVLSNLFPYKFYFRGFYVESVECVLQGLKFKDKFSQRKVFSYYGFNANRVRVCADYDWKKEQIVYFQGKPIKRNSVDYDDFIDELYVSLLQNPLFVNALKQAKGKYIIHSMGNEDKTKTLLSRYEFEFMLNCLKDYIAFKKV